MYLSMRAWTLSQEMMAVSSVTWSVTRWAGLSISAGTVKSKEHRLSQSGCTVTLLPLKGLASFFLFQVLFLITHCLDPESWEVSRSEVVRLGSVFNPYRCFPREQHSQSWPGQKRTFAKQGIVTFLFSHGHKPPKLIYMSPIQKVREQPKLCC